jgi:hypothetical protein
LILFPWMLILLMVLPGWMLSSSFAIWAAWWPCLLSRVDGDKNLREITAVTICVQLSYRYGYQLV